MPSNRMSIYPSLATDRLFDAVPGCTSSGRISQAADAYMQIMNDELAAIRWNKNQWLAVLAALEPRERDNPGWAMAWASISSKAPSSKEVDTDALGQQVRGMSVARQMAVYEAAQRFWARSNLPVDDRLALSGITPTQT